MTGPIFHSLFAKPAALLRAGAAIVALGVALGMSGAACAQGVQVSAPHVVLMDFESGSVLFSRGAEEPLNPANLAKLMTLAVVFEELKSGRLKLDTEFIVSDHAWRTGGAPSGGPAMFAAARGRFRVEDLITGIAVVSGSDAAIALAEGISGSERAFASRMNELARKLGLETAHFTNPAGSSKGEQRISARDLAKLAVHLIRTYPDYYKYFRVPEITWSKVKQANRNPLLGSSLGVDGLAIGPSRDPSAGFVASGEQNGRRLIAVVFGAKTEKERVDDARRLLDWGFRAFADRLLFTGTNEIARAGVYGGTIGSVPLVTRRDIHVLSLQDTSEKFNARVVYQGPLRAPVQRGAEVAKLRVFRGDQLAYEAPLYAASDVPAGSMFGRAFDSAYEYVAGLMRASVRRLLSRDS